jgi:hypothetical protein
MLQEISPHLSFSKRGNSSLLWEGRRDLLLSVQIMKD